ncbi:MAG: hypothetical protein ABWY06_25050 [Pseudomonas sp.]|uniref:hypothetical protein n=1 Tax=Pseudomonas sp. TaxID=306 RepID=UPI00339B3DB5
MDKRVRKKLLIEAVRHYLKTAKRPIPEDPARAGDAVFAALLEDWERMSSFAQGQLLLAIAILAKFHGSEGRAEREIRNFKGKG